MFVLWRKNLSLRLKVTALVTATTTTYYLLLTTYYYYYYNYYYYYYNNYYYCYYYYYSCCCCYYYYYCYYDYYCCYSTATTAIGLLSLSQPLPRLLSSCFAFLYSLLRTLPCLFILLIAAVTTFSIHYYGRSRLPL